MCTESDSISCGGQKADMQKSWDFFFLSNFCWCIKNVWHPNYFKPAAIQSVFSLPGGPVIVDLRNYFTCNVLHSLYLVAKLLTNRNVRMRFFMAKQIEIASERMCMHYPAKIIEFFFCGKTTYDWGTSNFRILLRTFSGLLLWKLSSLIELELQTHQRNQIIQSSNNIW